MYLAQKYVFNVYVMESCNKTAMGKALCRRKGVHPEWAVVTAEGVAGVFTQRCVVPSVQTR